MAVALAVLEEEEVVVVAAMAVVVLTNQGRDTVSGSEIHGIGARGRGGGGDDCVLGSGGRRRGRRSGAGSGPVVVRGRGRRGVWLSFMRVLGPSAAHQSDGLEPLGHVLDVPIDEALPPASGGRHT
eukprot:5929345-Pleurochrysis_carterae.AAC.1